MIELTNVRKEYGETLAVEDLSLRIPTGTLCVLIGPSGCGKTTTLRMINRLVEPTSGSIRLDGSPVETRDVNELRRNIGYVIQQVGLFPHMTVSQNVATVPRLLKWDKKSTAARVNELLDLVGLDPGEYGEKYPSQLSGGEAQRIGVARALAADPQIVLMDEPFGAVDPLTRDILQSEFIKIQRKLKKTVVFVTHDIDEAIRMADTVVVMQEGRIVQADSPEDLLARPATSFVRDFVGADRALKRLARFAVADIMVPAEGLGVDLEATEIASEYRFPWVVDEDGRFVGWVDTDAVSAGTTVGEALHRVVAAEFCLREEGSVKDALSRMIHEGVQSLPVADGDGRLTGSVTLAAIQEFSTRGTAL